MQKFPDEDNGRNNAGENRKNRKDVEIIRDVRKVYVR